MARGIQLQVMVRKLRAEIGQSVNTALGETELDELQQLIRRHQELLYDAHDWEHLKVRNADKVMSAGQRYYDFPADFNLERIVNASVYWGGQWTPVDYGIDPTCDYNAHDSDNDARLDPVLKWSIYSPTQFEAWPIPATATTLRFSGVRKLGALTSDDDVSDLDDIMIVLFAAAEKRAGKPDGKVKATLAQNRFNLLTGRMEKHAPFRFGESSDDNRPHRGTVIRIAGA